MMLTATQRFASPIFSAFDVACAAAKHERSDDEVAATPQVVIPRRGAFVWRIGGRSMLAEPNTVLLFHPRHPHRISHPINGGDDCTSLHFAPEHLDDALSGVALGPRYWVLDGPSQQAVHVATHIARAHADTLAREEAAMSILRLLANAPEPPVDRHAATVDALRERIAADPADPATLQTLSRGVGMSPYELARRFRARTGSSIHQYRLRLRLLLALSRLRDGASDVTSLAFELGFSSHAHFTTAFRRMFGMTPREARGTSLVLRPFDRLKAG
jgi:AraC family transcriptional regulator